MRALGIDGCKGGWIAAIVNTGGTRDWRVVTSIESAIALGGDSILIDIPIGLPDTGRRACDLAARELLGAARSRVFLDVRLPLLRFLAEDDYAAANLWAKSDGAGISRQLWGILPKIAEVDRLLRPDLQGIDSRGPSRAFVHAAERRQRRGRTARRRERGSRYVPHFWGRRASPGSKNGSPSCAAAAPGVTTCWMRARWRFQRKRRRVEVARGEETDARGLRMDMWY